MGFAKTKKKVGDRSEEERSCQEGGNRQKGKSGYGFCQFWDSRESEDNGLKSDHGSTEGNEEEDRDLR